MWEPYPNPEVAIGHLPQPGKHFVGRDEQLELLDTAWEDPRTNIVEFVAFGGVGKSALVAHWLKQMQADGWRGAARVFGHSFYSQGSREDAQASADSFLDQALRFFGDLDPTAGSPWDKGERLARLVREQPTLLILDGVEPLQSPESTDDAGQVRDPGLQAMIIELAASSSVVSTESHGGDRRATGLTVISTRARVADIEGWEGTSVVSHELEHLSIEAGTALLQDIGVGGSVEELGQAVEEVGGHALSLTLVGRYVINAASGQIADRFEIGLPRMDFVPSKETDADRKLEAYATVTPDVGEMEKTLVPDAGRRRNRSHVTRTFSRIMQRYEVWLSGLRDREGDVEIGGRLALEIVRLTGLFDRPITAGEFAALVKGVESPEGKESHTKTRSHKDEQEHLRDFVPLCETGAIPGLTDLASEASEAVINLAVGNLVRYGLITKLTQSPLKLDIPPWPDPTGGVAVLDAHPLVREYFAESLKGEEGSVKEGVSNFTLQTSSFREAHRRLYEHLKQSAPELPDTLNDMMPLYHAVAHGCKAGLQTKTRGDVFRPRIFRANEFFAWRKLGAFGASLSALSSYFDLPWHRVVSNLEPREASFILNWTGACLRAVGRLGDTPGPMKLAISLYIASADWKEAALNASNLSELSLTLGDVSSAVRQGEQSVELADRSGDAFKRMSDRTTLAAALMGVGLKRIDPVSRKALGAGDEGTDSHQETSAPTSAVDSPAHLAFQEAEAMQKERQPQYPLLYSTPGYMYCEHLLADLGLRLTHLRGYPELKDQTADHDDFPAEIRILQSEIEAVRNRAETALRSYGDDQSMGTLNFALDHLTLGRTWLAEAELPTEPPAQAAGVEGKSVGLAEPEASGFGSLQQAESHLNESVSLLRQAGTQDELPRGLLHRSALWRMRFEISNDESEISKAERDLGEAETIAERGSMLIWQIEAALERTRLALALGDRQVAIRYLEKVRELIKKTERPYEPHVPDWDEWKPPAYVNVFQPGQIVGYHRHNAEIERLERELRQA
jgi:hypothetical protein